LIGINLPRRFHPFGSGNGNIAIAIKSTGFSRWGHSIVAFWRRDQFPARPTTIILPPPKAPDNDTDAYEAGQNKSDESAN
jgi:hypothetical protein